jgi:1-acyl-sn-glycerol-3-phosphate acyltransferase
VAGVFPEGSRSEERLMGPWKPGALRAAFATQATILPVTFISAGEFWPKGRWRLRFFQPNLIHVHKPIPYSEYAAGVPEGPAGRAAQEELAQRLRQVINGPILEREAAAKANYQAAAERTDPMQGREPTPEQAAREALERPVFRLLGW